jgi:HD-GYP domain-containing protein (c-di-GMP phosphodiesterase class II)
MDRLNPGLAALPAAGFAADGLRLSEVIGALSHALDLTEGQPKGHCVRCCWIGMHVAGVIGLGAHDRWELYYTLLLKDLGCSSNAARICELYLSDDLHFKRNFKTAGDRLPQMLRFVFTHTGLNAGLAQRLGAIVNILRNGPQIAQELIQTRCQRGADIARRLRFPEAVARGVHSLDEHWNGGGKPEGLRGEAIPLFARIALLAQVVDVFRTAGGAATAVREVRRRAGRWLDPALVRAFDQVARDAAFWRMLDDPGLDAAVLELEPLPLRVPLSEDYLDDIATAFGQVVDAKSPYTSGHSERVAHYVDGIAGALGLSAPRRRWLRRGALLHDVGKLGVSNAVLDKPGALDDDEWARVREHAVLTETILARIGAFGELARVAAAHHERLDGGGYPRRLDASQITLETRIITVADIFDAISADRPYRAAVPVARTLEMMARNVGTAIDPLCFEALRQTVQREAGEHDGADRTAG